MNNPKIIKPKEKFLLSYFEACKESWDFVHDRYILHAPDKFEDWKNTIFHNYTDNENGINLPKGYVSSTTFWIVDGDDYVGTINLRHKLTPFLATYGGHAGLMIRLSRRGQGYGKFAVNFILKEAHKIIPPPLLITCQETNQKSIQLFEKFPFSKMEKAEIELYGKKQTIRRYYFDLPQNP